MVRSTIGVPRSPFTFPHERALCETSDHRWLRLKYHVAINAFCYLLFPDHLALSGHRMKGKCIAYLDVNSTGLTCQWMCIIQSYILNIALKREQESINVSNSYLPSYLLEFIVNSILGTFPQNMLGKKSIFIITDWYYSLTRAIPKPKFTSAQVADIFLNKWIKPYGLPGHILFDNRQQIVSKYLSSLWKYPSAKGWGRLWIILRPTERRKATKGSLYGNFNCTCPTKKRTERCSSNCWLISEIVTHIDPLMYYPLQKSLRDNYLFQGLMRFPLHYLVKL